MSYPKGVNNVLKKTFIRTFVKYVNVKYKVSRPMKFLRQTKRIQNQTNKKGRRVSRNKVRKRRKKERREGGQEREKEE